MAQVSGRQAVLAALKVLGWTRDYTAKTSKYEVYTNPGTPHRLLVGAGGALRKQAPGKTVAESISLTETRYHKTLINLGKTAEGYTSREQASAAFSALYHAGQPVRSVFNQPSYTDDTCVEPGQPC